MGYIQHHSDSQHRFLVHVYVILTLCDTEIFQQWFIDSEKKKHMRKDYYSKILWRKRWHGGMKKGKMSVPVIEEGHQASFIGGSVSPEWCHWGQHRINHLNLTHLLSSSVSFPSSRLFKYLPKCGILSPPTTFPSIFFFLLFPLPLFLSSALEVITIQSANQISSHLLCCGRPKSLTFWGKCHL